MLTVCSKTDIGRKRNINQDTVCAWPAPHGSLPNLFVVADGMGGHKAGDYASSYAVSAIGREVEMDESSEPMKAMNAVAGTAEEERYKKMMCDLFLLNETGEEFGDESKIDDWD